jgi:uncharacterized protein (DUF488 family)
VSSADRTIFTIGHSNHTLEEFLPLLRLHAVNAIADVRSQPYSRRMEHFAKDFLAPALAEAGIEYVFLGRELGARRDERACYVGPQAVYERIAELPAFRDGLARLERGAAQRRIALLCAEREPLDCHRTILVCRHLRGRGLHIAHILADGTREEHTQTEERLLRLMDVAPSLFEQQLTRADLIERAYELRGREIAYRSDREEELP